MVRARGTAAILLIAAIFAGCSQSQGEQRSRPYRARAVYAAATVVPRTVYAGSPSLPPLATDRDLFAYDAAAPLNPTEKPLETTRTYTTTAVTYQTYDGTVPGLFYAPTTPGPFPCVISVHGVTSNKGSSIGLRDLVVPAGYAMFTIDARFHGDRGTPEQFFDLKNYPGRVRELFQGTVVDLRRAVDYLEQRPDCRPGKTGVIGTSMGGFIAATLAGADPRVQAPVLLFSGADWRLWFTTANPGVAGIFYQFGNPVSLDAVVAALDPLDPKHWVGEIAPRPVLMVHGDFDDAVPPGTAHVLYDAALDPKTILWYPGGHGPNAAESGRVGYTVVGFLDQYLKTP
ncbi:MAG: alpha/beta hydrolase family protein [Actinomycetota bacterium]